MGAFQLSRINIWDAAALKERNLQDKNICIVPITWRQSLEVNLESFNRNTSFICKCYFLLKLTFSFENDTKYSLDKIR